MILMFKCIRNLIPTLFFIFKNLHCPVKLAYPTKAHLVGKRSDL